MCAGPNPLFAMHCGAKEENAVLVPKPLKINGSRSVHAELGVTGVTFAEVSSGGTLRNSTATCMMILHIAHMPSSYAELGEGNYDAAKREYEIVLEHSI